MPISLKIDVSKIDKSRLFKGAKGTYLDAILIETPEGKYGDYMIAQSVSKEERQAGVKGAILGNGKNIGGGGGYVQPKRQQEERNDDLTEDVPF